MSQNTEALINTLQNDQSWEARRDAAKELASIKTANAVDALIDALKDDDEWVVRFCAADALGAIGDEKAIPHLASAIQNDEQTVVEHSVKALAQFGSKAIDIFSKALQNKDSENSVTRSYVVRAMGNAKDAVFLPLLLEALNDPAVFVVQSAILSLGQLGDPSVAETLLGMLKDSSNLKYFGEIKASLNKLGVDASDDLSSAELRAKKAFLSTLKSLKIGMSDETVTKLVGSGVFQMGNNVVYRNLFGEFQLIIANGRLVKFPEGFGPEGLIKKLEEELSSSNKRWWEFWK